MRETITFDFHNTLIECDHWFRIEVRTLVSDVLRYWHALGEIDVPSSVMVTADAEYRKLRLSIHGHGHELPADRAVRVILDRVGFSLPWDAIDIALDSMMRGALRSARPVDGASETVAALADAGVQLGVVSSAVYHEFLLWSLERFGMLESFGPVVTSASCGFYKSRPEIYWSALTELGTAPHAALHVGDSLRFDVGGASRAGMRTAWFRRSNVNESPSSSLDPDLVLPTLTGATPALLAAVQRA